ncbi:MAG TPA: LacI family DNA-binding transcriptional regulator [Devosia sp.]|nr:LacI family DNA-binding transcriptional regulator [Devosia sp.]
MSKAIIRLKDIAGKTGFSTNTVSLALRESPRIPAPTRALIQQAAAELHYLPNQIAKSLVSRQTMTIGLVLTDITNPTLTHAAKAIELALAARGYGTLFATSNNTLDEEKRTLEMFRSRQVDGMLIYPTNHRQLDHIRPLRRANYPVVLLVADPDAGIDAVCVDERRGAWKAVRHLLEMGHRRIGMLDSSSQHGNGEKREGYLKALAETGLAYDASLTVDLAGHAALHGMTAMDELMSRKTGATAVFCANDSLAIGALHWCQRHGVAVPQQMAIMGCDDIEYAAFAGVPLSSIRYATRAVSDLAVERLMELIAAKDILPPPRVSMIDPDLIIRDSTRLIA